MAERLKLMSIVIEPDFHKLVNVMLSVLQPQAELNGVAVPK